VNRWFTSTCIDHFCLTFVFKHTIYFENNKTQITRIRFEGFIKKKGQPGYTYIILGRDMPYLFKMYSDSNKYLYEADFIEILKILIGNIVVIIDAHIC